LFLKTASGYNKPNKGKIGSMEMDKGKLGESELLTVDEAARILKLYRGTVIGYIQEGRLPGIKVGYKTIRIRREDLNKFIESHHGLNYFLEEAKRRA